MQQLKPPSLCMCFFTVMASVPGSAGNTAEIGALCTSPVTTEWQHWRSACALQCSWLWRNNYNRQSRGPPPRKPGPAKAVQTEHLWWPSSKDLTASSVAAGQHAVTAAVQCVVADVVTAGQHAVTPGQCVVIASQHMFTSSQREVRLVNMWLLLVSRGSLLNIAS